MNGVTFQKKVKLKTFRDFDLTGNVQILSESSTTNELSIVIFISTVTLTSDSDIPINIRNTTQGFVICA